jgi:hypothetical protein
MPIAASSTVTCSRMTASPTARSPQRFLDVRGLADHVEVRLGAEQLAQTTPHDHMVVHDEDPHRRTMASVARRQ